MRLNRTLGIHERFLVLLKEGNVHRLKQLINVAFNCNRNMNYILGKLVDSIKGIYNPQPDQDDKDLAFLILQFGGPALLDICHRAINLPSSSTAYRLMKGKRTIKSTVHTTPIEALSNVKTK